MKLTKNKWVYSLTEMYITKNTHWLYVDKYKTFTKYSLRRREEDPIVSEYGIDIDEDTFDILNEDLESIVHNHVTWEILKYKQP